MAATLRDIALVVLVAAMFAAGYMTNLLMANRSGNKSALDADMGTVRWEVTGYDGSNAAVHWLRRHMPTHDITTNVPFLDIMKPKGVVGEATRKQCAGWTIAIVMTDKRTRQIGRMLLDADDGHAEQKKWVLRRAGFKVAVVDMKADEDGMRQALAA